MIENNNQVTETEIKNATELQTPTNNQPTENKPKNNKKTLIIIISAIAALIVIVAIILIVSSMSSNKKPNDNKPSMTPEEKQEYLDKLNSQEGMNLSQTLYNYAVEIYNNKKYELLPKDENGVYFATKYDLELMNYDISLIPEECAIDKPIIFFDVDKKVNESYEFEPVYFNTFCEEK